MSPEEIFRVLLHHALLEDLKKLPRNMRDKILNAIEDRLSRAPAHYGDRLRKSLHGFWKLRVGDYRIIYEILAGDVRIHGIMHRREVYERNRATPFEGLEGSRRVKVVRGFSDPAGRLIF